MTPKEILDLVNKETSYPWIKIKSNGTDKKKTRTVNILSVTDDMLLTRDYNNPEKIYYDTSTIISIKVFEGNDLENNKTLYREIYNQSKIGTISKYTEE